MGNYYNRNESEAFPVINDRKQNCVFAPTCMVFSAMLGDAFSDCQDGIPIKYRTNSQVFTKVKVTVPDDILFADDRASYTFSNLKFQTLSILSSILSGDFSVQTTTL